MQGIYLYANEVLSVAVTCIDQLLESRCRANKPVDLNHFVSLRLTGSWHSTVSSPATICQLSLSFVYPSTAFRLTPVNPVPVIPTALSKNLSGPLSISELQGSAKSGFVCLRHFMGGSHLRIAHVCPRL